MKKILILKLVSGEEIIGTVYDTPNEYLEEHNNKNWDIIKLAEQNVGAFLIIHIPVQIMYAPGQGLGMLPFQHYTEVHSVIIPTEGILTISNPAQELLDGYTSKFIHGISLAKKPGLIV